MTNTAEKIETIVQCRSTGAYEAGCQARNDGRPLSANPHPRATVAWVHWRDGWFGYPA